MNEQTLLRFVWDTSKGLSEECNASKHKIIHCTLQSFLYSIFRNSRQSATQIWSFVIYCIINISYYTYVCHHWIKLVSLMNVWYLFQYTSSSTCASMFGNVIKLLLNPPNTYVCHICQFNIIHCAFEWHKTYIPVYKPWQSHERGDEWYTFGCEKAL